MTMLTYPGSRFKPIAHPSGPRDTANAARIGARRAMLKRICLHIVVGLLAGGAMAAIIALRTAAYFWRFPI
ncbi:MAG: hypothetical protein ACREEK_35425 [Bradyrhizobium sp.]